MCGRPWSRRKASDTKSGQAFDVGICGRAVQTASKDQLAKSASANFVWHPLFVRFMQFHDVDLLARDLLDLVEKLLLFGAEVVTGSFDLTEEPISEIGLIHEQVRTLYQTLLASSQEELGCLCIAEAFDEPPLNLVRSKSVLPDQDLAVLEYDRVR